MSEILSAVQPASDMLENEILFAVYGCAAELTSALEIEAGAEAAFEEWWDGLTDLDHRALPEEFCRTVFVAGYLAMTREPGSLPEGGAA